MLQFWEVINNAFIHKSHHIISNLKSKEIKFLLVHSLLAVQIPCNCQTTRIIHFRCRLYISFCIAVHVWPSVSTSIVLLLRWQILVHLILAHDSFSIWSRSRSCGNLLVNNVSSNNACPMTCNILFLHILWVGKDEVNDCIRYANKTNAIM